MAQEPLSRTAFHARRSCAPVDGAQTRTQLELWCTGAGSACQPGLSPVHAQAEKVIRGNKLRVDTTVVETNIHYPTDSVLLGDGVRVLTRTMQAINQVVGDMGEKLRDRRRSVGHRLIEIGRASRGRGPQVQKKLEQGYRK